MTGPDLLIICTVAFVAVFLLLTLLAVAMRVLIMVFPAEAGGTDAAAVAAVTAAVSAAFPGTKVTKIEEEK